MSFLAPLALISAAIIGPLIVALYMLRLRRDDHAVSSTFLWRRMVRDVEANTPWQKLRPNLLLLLQLLILLLLALALARPFFKTHGISGRNLIIIIDRSASMGATDVAPNRLEAARKMATRLVDQLPDGGRATIIAAGGPSMDVPASATNDRRELHQAIDTISLRHGGGSDLAQPLTLASALAAHEEQSEIAIISDGNVTIPTDLSVAATVRYFPIGRSSENLAISALALQPAAAGQTLFAQVINYGEEVGMGRLDVFLDGEIFNAYNLTLGPEQEQSIVVDVPAQVSTVDARLTTEDAHPLDNHARAVSSLGTTTQVRLVGSGNYFLETGLGLLPGVEIIQRDPTWSIEQEGDEAAASLVPITIFDGVVPQTLPPGNLFFIAPPESSTFFSVTGKLDLPLVRPAPGNDPLLRNVSLSEVSVFQAVRLDAGLWARTVVDSERTPLLVAGEYEGRRLAVLAFDLHQSDLPLQVAFPLLLSNLVNFLSPGSGAEATQLAPGQPLALQVDPAISEVRLTRPDGTQLSSRGGPFQEASLRIQNRQLLYADTDDLGIYTVELLKDGEQQAVSRFAVNLFSPGESNIKPQPQLAVEQTSGLQSAVTRERAGKQEFWRWLAALALALLLIEWLVYHKNGLALLREQWRRARARG
jgi:Ca-activated chloride channel homolog